MFNVPPSWVMHGAKYDFDFSNGRSYGGGMDQIAAGSASKAIQRVIQGSSMTVPTSFYVVDILGNLSTVLTLSPRIGKGTGLWVEGKYKNICLQSRDQTNASWTKTTMTAAKNQPSADTNSAGNTTANAASSLTSTAPSATSLQSITQASALMVGSAWVKRLTGSGTVTMTMDNATFTDITSQINSTTYTWIKLPSQTLTNPTFGFTIATSGDAIAVDHCQLELNGYCTTPIPTTTTAQTRNADEPAIADPAGTAPGDGARLIRTIVCTGGPWSYFVSAAANSGTQHQIATDGGVTIGLGTDGGAARFQANSNTETVSGNTGAFGIANINKSCGRANGQGTQVCLNGGAISTVSSGAITSLGAAFTHWGLGNNGAASIPLDGYIKRLVFWNREITDSEMVNYTASDSPYGN